MLCFYWSSKTLGRYCTYWFQWQSSTYSATPVNISPLHPTYITTLTLSLFCRFRFPLFSNPVQSFPICFKSQASISYSWELTLVPIYLDLKLLFNNILSSKYILICLIIFHIVYYLSTKGPVIFNCVFVLFINYLLRF